METQVVLCREPVEKFSIHYPRPSNPMARMEKKTSRREWDLWTTRADCHFKAKYVDWGTIIFDWMKRRIQPLQARESLGFQYQGTTDPSRYSKEEISDDVVLSRIQWLLNNVNNIPVVPGTFSAANPLKQVLDKSSRFIEIEHFYHSVNLIGFAFCRRTWIALRVVLHYQAFVRPFSNFLDLLSKS